MAAKETEGGPEQPSSFVPPEEESGPEEEPKVGAEKEKRKERKKEEKGKRKVERKETREKPIELQQEQAQKFKDAQEKLKKLGDIEQRLHEIARTIEALGETPDENFLDELVEEEKKLNKQQQEIGGEIRQDLQDIADAVGRDNQTVEGLDRFLAAQLLLQQKQTGLVEKQYELAEAMTPEALRVPTRERYASEQKKEPDQVSDEELIEYADDWFEQRLRHLESFEGTFESQPIMLQPLQVAVTYFENMPETRRFGAELRKKLEARRIRQAMVRIWNLSTPEPIFNSAGVVSMSTLKELFTARGRNGNPVIAEEFQNLEKMGCSLKEVEESMEGASKKERDNLKQKAREIRKEILDYVRRGGKEGGEYVDEKIQGLESEWGPLKNGLERLKEKAEKLGKTEELREVEEKLKRLEEKLEKLRELRWARNFAGGLWSITERAAYFDVKLNGTGDFFAQRLSNMVKKLEGSGLSARTKGIWNPEKGTPFDFGMRDFFSGLFSKAVHKSGSEKDQINQGWLRAMGFKLEDAVLIDTLEPPKKGRKKKDYQDKKRIDVVKSLAEVDLGKEEFWDDWERKFDVEADEFNTRMYYFMVADLTRKKLMGADGFFDNPSLRKFLEMKGLFEHIPESRKTVLLGKERVEIAARQEKWQDLLERMIKFGRTKKGKEILEDWAVFPDAQVFGWIQRADDEELITSKQRDYLLKEYLSIRLPIKNLRLPLPVKETARQRAMWSLITGPLRYGPTRAMIVTGTFWELLKRAAGYVFEL